AWPAPSPTPPAECSAGRLHPRGAAMATNPLPGRFPTNPTPRRLAATLAAVALLGLALSPGRPAPDADGRQGADRPASRPRPGAPGVKPAALGEEVQTQVGQRRRLLLPGGAVLYVNQNTTVKLDAARQVTLATGEIFVEANARDRDAPAFVI